MWIGNWGDSTKTQRQSRDGPQRQKAAELWAWRRERCTEGGVWGCPHLAGPS